MTQNSNLESHPQKSPQKKRRASKSGSFTLGLLSGVLAYVVLLLLLAGSALIAYAFIANDLPSPNDLTARASSFQSTRIYDRAGNLLNETFDPNAGRRTKLRADQIAPYLIQATVMTEDANFYTHRGVDPIALLRAIYYAIQEGDLVSGGSTISQQLVKMTYLSPERTLSRKINEAILAAEITRRYSKDEIIEIYLNELYYGNLSYGIGAAAKTYFDQEAIDLSLAEAALLAGLPQLPAVYDPYTNPDRAKKRQGIVLGLMVENNVITQAEADAAWAEQLQYKPLRFDLNAPHFTLLVRQQLEQWQGPEALYQKGLRVTTTLDPELQAEAQRIVSEHVHSLADHNVSNGALVSLRPDTGEILALVGSADFDNVEIDGQVNMALAPRQPGSALKPLVYLTAFQESAQMPAEERWTPGTLVADIREVFPSGSDEPYIPVNYDGREHGMTTVRAALGSSYNIPAVRALQSTGITSFVQTAERLGITTLTRPDYGLSLSLGSGEVPLLELTGSYAVLANGGRRKPPVAILRIEDSDGNVICDLRTNQPCLETGAVSEVETFVVSPIDAYLVTDILSDNEARTPAFGPNSVLNMARPAAVKTGTTNDFRDNLTVGYTPQLATGVWVGNTDNSEMEDISGVSGAGPIWREFMEMALEGEPVLIFEPPSGVEQFEVCTESGTQPSLACPNRQRQWFASDRPPLPPEYDLYRLVQLDRTTGKRATEFTPSNVIEEKIFKVYPDIYRNWAEEHGIVQPPTASSDVFTFPPEVFIREPLDGEEVQGTILAIGTANAPDFKDHVLQYGVGRDAQEFISLREVFINTPILDGGLDYWDTSRLPSGWYTLRLLVRDVYNNEYDHRIHLFVANATPTSLPTATTIPTETALPIATTTPTEIALPTATSVPVETPIPTATEQPTATSLPVPTNTAIFTAVPVDTLIPLPTATLIPATWTAAPEDTPTPLPTDTPIPATATWTAVPIDTPLPTDGPVPLPTATIAVSTATPMVEATPTLLIPAAATPTWTPALDDVTPEDRPGPTPTWTRQRSNLAGDPALFTPTPERSTD